MSFRTLSTRQNVLIAHELLNWVEHQKKSTKHSRILKIDFSKAYDRIRWDFLIEVFKAYEFLET